MITTRIALPGADVLAVGAAQSMRCMIIGSLAFTVVADGAGPCVTFDATMTYGAGDGSRSVAIGDLDGDLDLDLAVTNIFDDNVSVLLNKLIGQSISGPDRRDGPDARKARSQAWRGSFEGCVGWRDAGRRPSR